MFKKFLLKSDPTPYVGQVILEEKRAHDRFSGTMFYLNYTTNLNLSRMADHKAHILIRINLLLLSFFVAKTHMGILAKWHAYLIPNLCLTASCLATIFLATLVVRPNYVKKKKENEPVNWLFFGDFQHHSLEAFHQAICNLQGRDNGIYEAMSRDLYWMGISLARKYRLLKKAYAVFLVGQLSTLCMYVLFFWWRHRH